MTEHFTMQGLVDRIEALEAQQKAAFKLGRNSGLDAAKNVALEYPKYGEATAEEIESLKDNTP